jgi:colicin import membrane protein
MTSRSPSAFALSTLLHASVAALVLLGIYYSQQNAPVRPVIFELVAGEGNNYAATEAPALGSSDGSVKFTIAKVKPAPLPAEPEVVETAPVEPVPVQVQVPDFNKALKRVEARQIKKAVAEAKAERQAEEKRLSKAEFDRLHGKSAASKTASVSGRAAKVPHIDAQGIARGVVGGSTANKTGGAGGKALRREEQSLQDSYDALLKQRVHDAFQAPPGLSDRLTTVIEMRVLADGTLTRARVARSSGSDDFDHAVLDAIARVGSIGPRPDGRDDDVRFEFNMRDTD